MEWLLDEGNRKTLALVIFFLTFCGIIIYVYGSRRRGEQIESYKHVLFLDDENDSKTTHSTK